VKVFDEKLDGVSSRLHFQEEPVIAGELPLLHPPFERGQIVEHRPNPFMEFIGLALR
jgi:hypothetical protein